MFNILKYRLYGGVDIRQVHNGGRMCLKFVPFWLKVLDTLVSTWISFNEIKSWYRYPTKFNPRSQSRGDKCRKTSIILLVLLTGCLLFETKYKYQTCTLIFFLNPCHFTALIQMYLLIADIRMSLDKQYFERNQFICHTIYGAHYSLLSGAVVAILFPDTNIRTTYYQILNYYIEHILVLVVPIILHRSKPWLYKVPSISLTNWNKNDSVIFFGTGLCRLYYAWFIQLAALVTGINVNNAMCPSPSDPFKSTPFYRTVGLLYLAIIVFIIVPVYSVFSRIVEKIT